MRWRHEHTVCFLRFSEDGKTVFMAVPRLAGDAPFFRLDPGRLYVAARQAASIKGASRYGRSVALAELVYLAELV